MSDPEDGIRREYRARREDVDDFDRLMAEHAVPEPARSALHAWVETHLIGPVLEIGERVLRGVQGRN